jgi:hypothetical protein
MGAGVIAGGPYFCAQGSVFTATTSCSCTNDFLTCRVRPGGTRVNDLIAITDWFAASQTIDPTSAMASHRVWMFSGSADSVVPPAVMTDLQSYYRHYISASRISYKRDLRAEHAMPTDSYGNSCLTLGSPYINNCNYDAAGELLNWIYGPLSARNSGPLTGRFIAFDQSEFIACRPGTAWRISATCMCRRRATAPAARLQTARGIPRLPASPGQHRRHLRALRRLQRLGRFQPADDFVSAGFRHLRQSQCVLGLVRLRRLALRAKVRSPDGRHQAHGRPPDRPHSTVNDDRSGCGGG